MVEITFRSALGAATTVQGAVGATVMQTAVGHGVDGIVAECGGEMMCATCHVHVDEAWLAAAGDRADGEDDMVGETASPADHRSRLSCQIVLSEALDGLVVHLPPTQT